MSIPVYIIAGFLGAGKTTLLNNLLSTVPKGRKIAVVVNEFGKTGIDGRLVGHHGFMVKEVSGGCVCCTLRTELLRALEVLAADKTYDEIIIESTGLALPAQMASDIESLKKTVDIINAGIFGIVDGLLYYRLPAARAMMLNRQLLESDCILINKTDLLAAGMNISIRETLANILGNSVPIVESSFATIDLPTFKELLKVNNKHVHEPAFGQVIKSVTGYKNIEIMLDPSVDVDRLKLFFEKFSPVIVRAKGILNVDTRICVIQYSSSGFCCEVCDGPATNRLVMILDVSTSGNDKLTSELTGLDGCRVLL